MIIILILGGIAFFWFIAISLGCLVVKAQNKEEKQKRYEEYLRNNDECKHIWIKEVSDSAHYKRCSICKKIK